MRLTDTLTMFEHTKYAPGLQQDRTSKPLSPPLSPPADGVVVHSCDGLEAGPVCSTDNIG